MVLRARQSPRRGPCSLAGCGLLLPVLAISATFFFLLLILAPDSGYCGRGSCNTALLRLSASFSQAYESALLKLAPGALPRFSVKLLQNEDLDQLAVDTSKTDIINSFLPASAAHRKIDEHRKTASISQKYLKSRERSGSFVTFGGSLGLQERKTFFQNYAEDIPCGFVNHPSTGFIVAERDKLEMDNCTGLVVITAIFGAYDDLLQPKHVDTVSSRNVCFFAFVDSETLTILQKAGKEPDPITYKVGFWHIILVDKLPYKTQHAMNMLVPKHLPHRLFPNSAFSIWLEGGTQLLIDPSSLIEGLLLRKNITLALPLHPHNVHTLEEAAFCVRWRLCDRVAVWYQVESYCSDGLQPWSNLKHPYPSDVPDSSLILRMHEPVTSRFSCLWFNELEIFSSQDQLAFAYVRDMMTPKVNIDMFSTNLRNLVSARFPHLQKLRKIVYSQHSVLPTQRIFSMNTSCSSYLQRMWET